MAENPIAMAVRFLRRDGHNPAAVALERLFREPDEATVERVARAMYERRWAAATWAGYGLQEAWRSDARAALRALATPAEEPPP